MKAYVIVLALIAVLALPSVSSACQLTEIDGSFDCNGWSACFSIFFND